MCFVFADNDYIGPCGNLNEATSTVLDEIAVNADSTREFSEVYDSKRQPSPPIPEVSSIRLSDSYSQLHILSVSMGVYNGGVGPDSVKGITSVKVNGAEVSGSAVVSYSVSVSISVSVSVLDATTFTIHNLIVTVAPLH